MPVILQQEQEYMVTSVMMYAFKMLQGSISTEGNYQGMSVQLKTSSVF